MSSLCNLCKPGNSKTQDLNTYANSMYHVTILIFCVTRQLTYFGIWKYNGAKEEVSTLMQFEKVVLYSRQLSWLSRGLNTFASYWFSCIFEGSTLYWKYTLKIKREQKYSNCLTFYLINKDFLDNIPCRLPGKICFQTQGFRVCSLCDWIQILAQT